MIPAATRKEASPSFKDLLKVLASWELTTSYDLLRSLISAILAVLGSR